MTHLKAKSVADYAKKAFDEKIDDIVEKGRKKLEAAIEHQQTYPMCTKLSEVRNDKAVIDCFLEWLEENKLKICELTDTEHAHGDYFPVPKTDDQLLMEYFGIDATQLEKERRKILAEQRKLNERKP